jgi:hypothetical protein
VGDLSTNRISWWLPTPKRSPASARFSFWDLVLFVWNHNQPAGVWHPRYHRFNNLASCESSSLLWESYLSMAAPSRPYVYPPVLVRRDDPRMAATSVVVGDENENEENMDVGSGGTTGSQQWNADGIGELPPPISSSRPLNSPMSTQDVLPSRSGEPSNPAIPTPADNQETSFQASAAPSSSMNASSTFPLEFVSSTIRPTLTFQADANTMDGMVTIQAASTTTPAFLEDSGAKIENEALPGVNQGDPSLVPVPGMNQGKFLMNTPSGHTLTFHFHLCRNDFTGDGTCSDTSRNP